MARRALDNTVGGNDFYDTFNKLVAHNPQINQQIIDVKNESNLFLCEILKFYTINDMAQVKLLDNNETVICHNSHEILSYSVSINCMCEGSVGSDLSYGSYIKPHSHIYGVVAKVRWRGNTDEYCLLSCVNLADDNNLKSVVNNGEIKLSVGDSTISIMDNRVNITTPALFINGLPSTAPELENYYNKTEMNIIKSDSDAQLSEEINKLEKRLNSLIKKNNLIEDDDENNGENG